MLSDAAGSTADRTVGNGSRSNSISISNSNSSSGGLGKGEIITIKPYTRVPAHRGSATGTVVVPLPFEAVGGWGSADVDVVVIGPGTVFLRWDNSHRLTSQAQQLTYAGT